MEQIRREMGFVHESNWLGGTGYTVKAGTTWTSTLVFYQGVTPTGKHIKFSDTRIHPSRVPTASPSGARLDFRLRAFERLID
jgi:hypothetical protein